MTQHQNERGRLARLGDEIDFGLGFVTKLSIILMGAYWLCILGYKAVTKAPVLYTFYPEVAAETVPPLYIGGLLLLSILYNSAKYRFATPPLVPVTTLEIFAPIVLGFGMVIFAGWTYAGPHKDASYVPLASLMALSAWGWYAARWGHLRRRGAHAAQRLGEQTSSREGVEDGPSRVSRPTMTFASIHGNEAVKQRLLDAGHAITARRKEGAKPRNGILMHGLPGNGKNMFAEALAGELKLPFHQLSFADVASHWVGEKSSRVRAAFDHARRAQPCLLFIDEIDSFLEARDGRNDGVKEDRDLVNAMLTLLVDMRKERVVIVAATNHLDRLDAAGIREGRFDFKIEITPPDEPARLGLLRRGLRENVPGAQADEAVLVAVAKRWNGFSSKRILAVTEELPNVVGVGETLTFDDFMVALRQLQGQRGHIPEQGKTLDELVLEPATREVIDQLVARMEDPERTERLGGTLPTGVLFTGPPGTGKTATCRALAKKLGWAFLPAVGADLARDPKKLESLYSKAQDLRPTIIFIDEGEELLRSREYSQSTEGTNKLLTLMDGVGDKVCDVVWIAATNHPDQIDSALLRGGRFTEKVRFNKPSAATLAVFVAKWLTDRKVQLAGELNAEAVALAIGNESIANVEAVLQAAVNRAVARKGQTMAITDSDIQQAVDLVLSEA
jgi:transitional endoplasmic reticulum ATPase